ncbi:hypothetical protein FGF01_05380 [Aeromonas salmonicida subsp. achromogenes]|uniref:hypothetical protein n=1 Tax=Aeromonas salmonicida TaxID=645 RepID=UPI0009E6448B|nr:hypothetical protein [Aeromonas salmonicida]HAT3955922.1 hypothetical protein [Kluyvera ascorbata]TMX12295.1 hypothetical protein FGF01_05380 [Aeromonas salmonicida subsp. achromogenes]TMX15727.1 hypothetical protein FGE99_05375 [Aeromonas salmonicida subsp. achromogenes]TMX16236.1 hypothetical protein FGF02_04910 [Aeromonas salmonicida subsp. achromogenes]TMX20545.1 hypothetical protein FGF00_05400 [Aeromonas salmonicida subsp. achromogenes]
MGLFNKENESQAKLQALEHVISHSHRGVYKRIDENRELLELLYKESPELLNKFPWVRGWIESQDAFLNELANLSGSENTLQRVNENKPYPRSFPQKPEI